MELLPHAIAWCKGEIFEGRLVLATGLVVIVLAIVCATMGTTPAAKAMFYPLLVIGMVMSGGSAYMQLANPSRIAAYTQAAQQDPEAFMASEKARVENIIRWYPITLYTAAGVGVVAIVLFLFWTTPIGRAISLSLMFMVLTTFVIDHFSEERARGYYQHILAAEAQPSGN